MNGQTAAAALRMGLSDNQPTFEAKIAQDFTDFLNEFHSYSQPYDDAMDAELHEMYARILREQSKWGYFSWKTAPDGTPRPLFGPSSAGKDERELYEKVRRSKRDESRPEIQQRRWTALGSQVGDLIQREIMLAERHFEKLTGKAPRFRFARTERNEPCFEHFTKVIHECAYDGEKFAINGLGDGILEYITDDGEILRVGLEIKSKQTSYSETGVKRLTEPKEDHALQTVCYSKMYGLDYFIVLYVNTSKKAWYMTDDEREKSPDIRAFGKYISQADRDEVLAKFARVTKAAREGKAPRVDLTKFKFNDFKTAIAESLSEEEVADLRQQVERVKASRLPDWKKRGYIESLEFIENIRKGEAV